MCQYGFDKVEAPWRTSTNNIIGIGPFASFEHQDDFVVVVRMLIWTYQGVCWLVSTTLPREDESLDRCEQDDQ